MPHYVLSWRGPHERMFDVQLSFVAPQDEPRLRLPRWRPGRYILQNYAANVREWSAGERRIWKDGTSSWRVAARAGDEVTVHYRYYAGVLDAGSSFLAADEAYFNGSNLFMLVDGLRDDPHSLVISAPPEWQIETQLERRGEGGAFAARNYDHLIDSPVIAAERMTRHSFDEAGATVHLVFRNDEGLETSQYVEPLRAIVASQAALFGGLPLREYRFLFHVGDRWHGVEHEDSCSIIVRRSALIGAGEGDEGYDHLLSISAHELFHLWNVKRIVPAAFAPYDYWSETPTRLLWVMEGVTSYYGDLSLVRAGVWDVRRYLTHLAEEIETYESSPARAHLSLSQVSWDAWLMEPAHMHDRGNASYSFYNKGEIVAALLDLTIRMRTGGTRSLDDVMRSLWQEYGQTGRGLEEDGFERAVQRVADAGDFFARYVAGTDPLPYAEVFAAAGLSMNSATRNGGMASLGVVARQSRGMMALQQVVRGGAAMSAGALPGDELVAVGGMRITSEADLERACAALADSPAEMVVARAGLLLTLTLPVVADPRVRIKLRVDGDSPLRDSWLRRD